VYNASPLLIESDIACMPKPHVLQYVCIVEYIVIQLVALTFSDLSRSFVDHLKLSYNVCNMSK